MLYVMLLTQLALPKAIAYGAAGSQKAVACVKVKLEYDQE